MTEDGGRGQVEYKFERLKIYQLAMDYLDSLYSLGAGLPRHEEFNLHSQLIRAGTSIVLNIAEGSTSQSDAEQARFLSMALRSLVETIACRRIMARRKYVEASELDKVEIGGHELFVKIQAMRKALRAD
ncbi:MAG TPA: four helix bundle protein [Anaerolineae bacterium]